MPLSEHQKSLTNKRQIRFYKRNQEKILLKKKKKRQTFKRSIKQTEGLESQDIANSVVQSVHAKPQRHLDLSTLISFFEKEKENVQKELAPNTTAKEVSELKNFYRILELDKTESLIKHLTADPAL